MADGAVARATKRQSPLGADLDSLADVAAVCHRHERLRFDYKARDGAESRREVEPYRLVRSGARWYLLAWDGRREDYRSFRLDRMAGVRASTFRFRPRPAPDAVEHVRRAVTRAGYAHRVRVRLTADVEVVRRRVPAAYGVATQVRPGVTDLESSADDLASLARHLTLAAFDLGATLTVLDPPELASAIDEFTTRLAATRQTALP